MRPFTRSFAAGLSFAFLVALATAALVQAVRDAGPQDGSAGTPPMMDHAMPGHGHPEMSPADGRELVHFPPEMRTHMLRNMRDHVETLDGVLRALASADYDGAAKIAAERLGLDSPSAAACNPKPANAGAPAPGSMDEMMALYMPEQMRAIGLGMHTSASEFAVVASRAATTHDAKAAVEALSRVTRNCVACHAGYRLQ
jgi:hypothetical protein